jgi:hypothetical protein
VPTGGAATTSKGSVTSLPISLRTEAISATLSASWSGCSRSTGKNPWNRTARRSGFRFPGYPPTHTGTPGPLNRPAPDERGDHRTESDRLCGGGDRRERDPGIGDLENRLPPADMTPEEDSVPSGILCLGGQPGDERRVP